ASAAKADPPTRKNAIPLAKRTPRMTALNLSWWHERADNSNPGPLVPPTGRNALLHSWSVTAGATSIRESLNK
ncbi:hypothetical protein, partial [Mesorhizobium sp.]|uniref:hypothetical protein n=1 Tax=Mesorhizobium sp. TaxID=1871066 RepID=UPI0025B9997A